MVENNITEMVNTINQIIVEKEKRMVDHIVGVLMSCELEKMVELGNLIRERGLPTSIVCSQDLYSVVKVTLGKYISTHQMFDTTRKNIITVLW